MWKRVSSPTFCVAVSVLLAAPGSAQTALFFFEGPGPNDGFGYAVSRAGDTNADGVDDLIVGFPVDSITATSSGSATVFSGADGRILHVFTGEDPQDRLGSAVSNAGDVNGDGFDDVIVGVPDDFVFDRGSARVYSGQDGSLLYKFVGIAKGDRFGQSVACAGDIDQDGFDDVIVGAPAASPGGVAGSGSAFVFSGATGNLLFQFDGGPGPAALGASVGPAGDVNADGVDDLIVGAPFDGANLAGKAFVFSGFDGTTLLSFEGNSHSVFFGEAVSGAGDVNGDGHADVIVGDHADDTNGQEAGRAHVFSGLDGSVIHSFFGASEFDQVGFSVAAAGDWNADGLDDLLVGVPMGVTFGEVRVYSGEDGTLLHSFASGESHDGFGRTIGAVQDLNGDGVNEVVIGASRADTSNGATGAAWVFSSQKTVGLNYCGPANLNSSGKSARIDAFGSRVVLLNDLRIEASDTAQDRFGYFLVGQTQSFVPFVGGSQGNFCLGGQIGRFAKEIQNSGAAGSFGIGVDLTNLPPSQQSVLAGDTWNFQAWFRDANPGPTSNFTDGLSITFY